MLVGGRRLSVKGLRSEDGVAQAAGLIESYTSNWKAAHYFKV